ncbi:FecR family protein [Chitinophaga sp. 30R24]|uniref:FecR family protein n=1 Tax=Chitinophaga sp. 30R24 TaxID=3248838 RepID=UPI003B8FE348
MNDDEYQIYFAEKLANTLSECELEFINRQIEEDLSVRMLWENFCCNFSKEDQEEHFARLDQNTPWDLISFNEILNTNKSNYPRSNNRNNFDKLLTVAAIIMAIIFIPPNINSNPANKNYSYTNGLAGKMVKRPFIVSATHEVLYLPYHELTFDNEGNGYFKNGEKLMLKNRHAGNGINTLEVPKEQNFKLVLNDGSKIILNSSSSISFPLLLATSGKREIWVKGEAFITVNKDPQRPFIVHTSGTDIQVLGTEFNVDSYDSTAIKVTLVTGSIKLLTKHQQKVLKPGHSAIAINNTDIKDNNTDQKVTLSWKSDNYYFENAAFFEINEVLKKWYGANLIYTDSLITAKKFTGVINRNQDLKFFLDNIAATADIKYTIAPNNLIYLKSN